jgi:hypothetical protein
VIRSGQTLVKQFSRLIFGATSFFVANDRQTSTPNPEEFDLENAKRLNRG